MVFLYKKVARDYSFLKSVRLYLYLGIKRVFDIIFFLVGLIFLLPVALFVKIAYMCTGDFKRIFYTQNRIGKNGKEFKFFKFRTMIKDADEVLFKMLAENEELREEYRINKKLKNDPRITKVGKHLRKSSLDELPQIIKGERRIVEVNNVGNVRDLGGLKVDTDGDGTVDGTLKYGVLFRGEKLGANGNAKDELKDLGVTLELDLRKASERANDDVALPNFKQIELIHYQIDLAHYPDNYAKTRAVVKQVMEDVVAGENIYFHCRIGADRTGTLAYILEGLLGVVDEDKLEDYDMSVFSGLVNRHRFYSYDASSSVSKTKKFMYMYDFMEDNGEILTWYMAGSDNVAADEALIQQFRAAMIESN